MIRFMHVPKTAGTSFVGVLHRQYVRGNAIHFELTGGIQGSDVERYAALEDDDRRRIALFTGHAPIRTGIPGETDPIVVLDRQ